MNVLVRGIGNVGTTVANVLLANRRDLGISQVYLQTRTMPTWRMPHLEMLVKRGAIPWQHTSDERGFDSSDVGRGIGYLFECTPDGVAGRSKEGYSEWLPNLAAASAQGSEKGFGVPFLSGTNDSTILGERFVHIVSCNTHGIGVLLRACCGQRLEELVEADVVVVRRSEDIGAYKSERLVGGTVVARHRDTERGTQHATDVVDLYRTVGVVPVVTSSDSTTPSQLLHCVRFSIEFEHAVGPRELMERASRAEEIAFTDAFDSNIVFEVGRRYGFQGRLYSQAILVRSSLLVTGPRVRGWAFVPQEGASILSTVHSFLLQTRHPNAADVMGDIKKRLLLREL